MNIDDIKFNGHGLIPAIVTDAVTGDVLTLAYMNKESLEISIKEGRTCFFSRSRQELWRKGETSGNVQRIVDITSDCDNDALLVRVNREGPACHTGSDSCFYNSVYTSESENAFSSQALYELIEGRKSDTKEGSYTSYLFQKGLDKILKKIGEECTEVIIAAKSDDRRETVYEIADLYYHIMVLMVEQGISTDEIMKELASRHVIDKKIKQEKQV